MCHVVMSRCRSSSPTRPVRGGEGRGGDIHCDTFALVAFCSVKLSRDSSIHPSIDRHFRTGQDYHFISVGSSGASSCDRSIDRSTAVPVLHIMCCTCCTAQRGLRAQRPWSMVYGLWSMVHGLVVPIAIAAAPLSSFSLKLCLLLSLFVLSCVQTASVFFFFSPHLTSQVPRARRVAGHVCAGRCCRRVAGDHAFRTGTYRDRTSRNHFFAAIVSKVALDTTWSHAHGVLNWCSMLCLSVPFALLFQRTPLD